MTLPTSSEVVRFDLEGAGLRSKLLRDELHEADVQRLWERLDRGTDLGAGAILRDFEGESEQPLARPVPPGVRRAISDTDIRSFHHHGTSDFHIGSKQDAVHWIEAGSVAIPMFVRNTGSPVLIVTLHGVLRRDKYILPRFEWVNSLRGLGHNVVSFADPTMDLQPKLEGGWWLGTHLLDLVPKLALLVARATAELGAKHLVIAGSSMGGFGALQLGAYFPEATVIAFNPQTDLRRYHVRRVTRVAMGSVFGADAEPSVTRVNVLARYSATGITPSRIRYVTNTGDQHHLSEHYEPFVNGLVEAGVACLTRTTRDDGPGHVKVPAEAFISTVAEEISLLRNG